MATAKTPSLNASSLALSMPSYARTATALPRAAAPQHHHASVRPALSVDAMLDEMKEPRPVDFVPDVRRCVQDDGVGVDPAHDLVLVHERVQERDLLPGDGPGRRHAALGDPHVVAVSRRVALERRAGDTEQLTVGSMGQRADHARTSLAHAITRSPRAGRSPGCARSR